MEKEKRVQKHSNRTALTKASEKANHGRNSPLILPGMCEVQEKKVFLSKSRQISTSGVKVSGYKEGRAHIKEGRGQYSQKIQTSDRLEGGLRTWLGGGDQFWGYKGASK